MGLGLGSVVGLCLVFGLVLRLGLVSGLYKNLAIRYIATHCEATQFNKHGVTNNGQNASTDEKVI